MRFFKYLVLIFLSTVSVNAFAELVYRYGTNMTEYPSFVEACNAWRKAGGLSAASNDKDFSMGPTGGYCVGFRNLGQPNATRLTETWNAFDKPKECPKAGTPLVAWLTKGTTHVPIRLCKDGCTFVGTGRIVEMTDYDNTILQSTGNADNCTNEYQDDPPPKCDKTDPYGDCYVPPDDKCVRAKDGSIFCPDNSKPPENNTCNGADYCKRPPEGCGPGYVPGSFNGQQLCVRSGPNVPKNPPDPDKPDDPNNCMNGGSYCPQPPDNTSCPSGYYETTYNGSKICVKNNPDPEKPNPNDPNTDGGGGSSEPTDGGGDGGTGGSINLKPVIDAINALKTALLNALSGISGKIDKLINGQVETNKKLDTSNEHLKNIKDESVKTNEKLDTSNGHLEKIEEATKSTSEAVGESNKKLDGLKDAVEGMYRCKNEAYNPNDKSSSKYRECTEQDAKNAFGEEPKMPFKELDLGSINTGLFKVTGQCPAPYQLYLPVVDHTFPIDISKLCDVLAIIGMFISLAAMIHGIAILVENS